MRPRPAHPLVGVVETRQVLDLVRAAADPAVGSEQVVQPLRRAERPGVVLVGVGTRRRRVAGREEVLQPRPAFVVAVGERAHRKPATVDGGGPPGPQAGGGIGQEEDRQRREDHVVVLARQARLLGVADIDGDVGEPAGRDVRPGQLDHRRCEVHAVHRTGGRDRGRGREQRRTAPAPHVDDPLARAQRRPLDEPRTDVGEERHAHRVVRRCGPVEDAGHLLARVVHAPECGACARSGGRTTTPSSRTTSRCCGVVALIPPGRVMSYGDIAEYLGAGGPRQVGQVMSRSDGRRAVVAGHPLRRIAPARQGERLPRPPAGRGDAAAAGRLAGRHGTRPVGRPPGLTVTSARYGRPHGSSCRTTRHVVRRRTRHPAQRPARRARTGPSAPVVAVAVYYDVGIRSEPEGRTGFAHLFEHLMFQGSASLGKMDHVKYVQSSGGTLNGSTRLDYTNYYEALPSNALERALFLEADRMRSPAVTEENLANQIAVVKEEIRVNVLNQPYGGFPWLTLPPLLFETFPNAHNGYGGFEDLESATVDDARDFFDRYYAPGNAVLAIGGDFDADQAMALVQKHFGDVPRRAVPARPDFDEPAPTSERRGEQVDPLAPAPAVALGWRVPDPDDLDAYLPVRRPQLGARDRRRVPAAPPAGAARTGWRPTSAAHVGVHGGRVRRAQPHRASWWRPTTAATSRRTGCRRGRRGARPGGDRRSARRRAGAGPRPARLGRAAGPGPRPGPDPRRWRRSSSSVAAPS